MYVKYFENELLILLKLGFKDLGPNHRHTCAQNVLIDHLK